MGDTPATRLRGGPGEEWEGLDKLLRHLETDEGTRRVHVKILKSRSQSRKSQIYNILEVQLKKENIKRS